MWDGVTRSTTQEPAAGPPEREPEQAMETGPPASPVSPNEDDLLSGSATTGVEAELASLRVTSSPKGPGDNEEASV